MYKIAFIYGDMLIYWNAIVGAMAVLTGIVLFWAAFLRQPGDVSGGAVACPMAIILSLILARIAHWYFRPDSYASFGDAIGNFSTGGYALVGCFAGCILTACILRAMQTISNLPHMLDAMSFGGCAAIAVGRLSCFFTSNDRGGVLTSQSLPWAFPVTNPTSGALEFRLAVFLFQTLWAAVIFVVLLLSLFRKGRHRDGDRTLIFLLLYCAGQIVLDSMRYDALHLRTNGFISAVQVFGAVTLVAVTGFLTFQLVKSGNWDRWNLVCWFAVTSALGCGGFMEYYVQRHGDRAVFAYTAMSLCMLLIVCADFVLLKKCNAKQEAQV